MLRELAISIYLVVFRAIFTVMKQFNLKNKTTFVVSFGDNIEFILQEMNTLNINDQIVILKTENCNIDFSRFDVTVLTFHPLYVFSYIRAIFHLATSRFVFVDNYFGFLAATTFHPEVKCIQLWHASGALKQFGLQDKTNQFRSPKAMNRFREVYKRFEYVVVGSEKMEHIFQESFALPAERFLRTGIPKTDFFFREDKIIDAKERITQNFPDSTYKKVILYAPTYRDDELMIANLALDLQKMYDALKDDYILFIRLHPAISEQFTNPYPQFVYDLSIYPNIQDVLICTDILVTDYSSIPFDFAMMNKPMLFYAYDLTSYQEKRGIIQSYDEVVPGPIVSTTEELIQHILTNNFSMDQIESFRQQWTTYSDGQATNKLVRAIYMDEIVEEKVSQPVNL